MSVWRKAEAQVTPSSCPSYRAIGKVTITTVLSHQVLLYIKRTHTKKERERENTKAHT